jgi:hypothetical protein
MSANETFDSLVRDASASPVFRIRVFFYQIHQQEIRGWELTDAGGPDETIPVLPPTMERYVDMPDRVHAMYRPLNVNDQTCVLSVEFTDAAGKHWHREPDGALNPGLRHV